MRDIKFRAKRKLSGEWVYGSYVKGASEDSCLIITELDDVLASSHYARVITSTVGQFTGLLDKNGKEIWEGDIIKWAFVNTGEDEPYYTEPVEWSECGFFLDGGAPLTVAMDDCEVIGNIYENPELLK